MQTTTPRRHPATILAVALLALSAAPAMAGDDGQTADDAAPRVAVQYSDLNLNSRAGVNTLYQRLRQASSTVCAPLDGRTLRERAAFAQCRRDSLERAVRDVGHSGLVALHGARTGHSAAG
jgi:UrcA family protein